jgi:hypothetical protein
MAGTTKIISGALRSTTGPGAPGAATTQQPQQQQQQQQTPPAVSSAAQAAAPAPVVAATGPEVVKDVNGRIIAFKGRRLSGWAVTDLIRLVCAWHVCVHLPPTRLVSI